LTLSVIILAHAIVTVGFAVLARISILNKDIWLAELRRTIAVFWHITFIGFSSAQSASWKELV
jgi:uncharacterized integral membrane protein